MELKNKDIVFVGNALANGGAARVMCVLAQEFTNRGMAVGVAAYKAYVGEYPLASAVAKEYGPAESGTTSKLRCVKWLRAVAKRNPAAVIISFEYFVNMQTILACAGLPNKVIVSERNDPSRVGNEWDWLRDRVYRRADMLVCQTRDAANYFSDKVRKCVILNPLKADLPEPYEGERRRAVVTFCRLEKQKNLGMLLRAFAEFSKAHDDYTLEIYGDGGERDSLISMAEQLGIADKTLIAPGRSDIHEVVRDATMFILPSDYEGLSNSMLEAMAIGLPVICTDCPCGGARMVIKQGKNGFLVPVGDCGALVDRMNDVVGGDFLLKRLPLGSVRLKDGLNAGSIASEWIEVIKGCKNER